MTFAICFDLNGQQLQQLYVGPQGGQAWQNAYEQVYAVLREYGFVRQQGTVYFGNEEVDAVTCVIAVQDCARRFPWFAPSVTDIRMLRIEANNDLMPAIAPNQPRRGL